MATLLRYKTYVEDTILAIVSLLLFISCRGASDREVVSVSIEPQRFLLKQIVGDDYDINVLLPPGSNPESYEPDMGVLRRLQQSGLYFSTGQLPFEQASLPTLRANFPSLRIVDASEVLHLLTDTHTCGHHHHEHNAANDLEHDGDHGEEHSHHEVDPHVWTSIENLYAMSEQMWREMVRLNPSKKSAYTANYNALRLRIKALSHTLDSILDNRRDYAFMIWHPSLSYFAHDHGIRQISVENEGKEVTPSDMRRVIDNAREHHAAILVVEKEINPHAAISANSDLGLPTLEVSLMQGDIFQTLIKIADALRKND